MPNRAFPLIVGAFALASLAGCESDQAHSVTVENSCDFAYVVEVSRVSVEDREGTSLLDKYGTTIAPGGAKSFLVDFGSHGYVLAAREGGPWTTAFEFDFATKEEAASHFELKDKLCAPLAP